MLGPSENWGGFVAKYDGEPMEDDYEDGADDKSVIPFFSFDASH